MNPTPITEGELDARYHTRSRLASGGNYGCGVLLYEGDLRVDEGWLASHALDAFADARLAAEAAARWGHGDLGTIAVAGDLDVRGALEITDRLHCLVVLGDLRATRLVIVETEVFVAGDVIAEVDDPGEYLQAAGAVRAPGRPAQ